jgi:hypothetical protein
VSCAPRRIALGSKLDMAGSCASGVCELKIGRSDEDVFETTHLKFHTLVYLMPRVWSWRASNFRPIERPLRGIPTYVVQPPRYYSPSGQCYQHDALSCRHAQPNVPRKLVHQVNARKWFHCVAASAEVSGFHWKSNLSLTSGDNQRPSFIKHS